MYGQPTGDYDPSMAMPPPQTGYYDPSMASGAMVPQQMPTPNAQPHAQMPESDAKNAKKEEKLLRQAEKANEDNAATAKLVMAWGVLNALFFVVPIVGDGWWRKVWNGRDINKLEIILGLFTMAVNIECKGKGAGVCADLQKYATTQGGHRNADMSLFELKKDMCAINDEACSTANRLSQAGMIPALLLPIAAVLEVVAMYQLYKYWNEKPTSKRKGMANQLSIFAPLVAFSAIAGWMLWSPTLQSLPRYWAIDVGHPEFAKNVSFRGLVESLGIPLGWCSALILFGMVSSLIRHFVMFTLPNHMDHTEEATETTRLVDES